MIGTKIVEDNEGHLSMLMILIFRSVFKVIWSSRSFFFNGNPYFWHRIRKEREILRLKWYFRICYCEFKKVKSRL